MIVVSLQTLNEVLASGDKDQARPAFLAQVCSFVCLSLANFLCLKNHSGNNWK